MKIIVSTKKPDEMAELLDKSSKGVAKDGKGFASMTIQKISDSEFQIDIDYALSNPVFTYMIKKELKKAILDFDREATFR